MNNTPRRSIPPVIVLFLLLGVGPAVPGWAQATPPPAKESQREPPSAPPSPPDRDTARREDLPVADGD